MELVLRDVGLYLRQLQHLVAERLWIFALERMAAAAALRGLDGLGVIGGQHGTLLPLVPRLAATGATRGRARRAALDRGRVARRRPSGVGGIPVQPLLQPLDQFLLLADLGSQLSHLGPERQNQGSGFGRQSVPQLDREWQPCVHSADIARTHALGHVGP